MKAVITGGAGFLGQRLAKRLLEEGSLTGPDGRRQPLDSLLLFDAGIPEGLAGRLAAESPVEVRCLAGDIAEPGCLEDVIDRDDLSVFHLASMVSAECELDFGRALQVNLQGNLNVLEACRARGGRQRVVFASSVAVFGGPDMPLHVGDATKQTPASTYGMTKAVGELLVNDYSRKGFIDGRSARLATVIVRPGAPNKAASGFASGLFREPLKGEDCRLPVDPGLVMAVMGYRTAVEGLFALHEVGSASLGQDRAYNLPNLSLPVSAMIDTLGRVAAEVLPERRLGAIRPDPDPAVQAVCNSWPEWLDDSRARALGLPADADLEAILRAYIDDYVLESR